MEKILEKIKNLTKQQKIVYGAIAAVGVVIIVTIAVIISLALGAGASGPGNGDTQEGGVKTYTIDIKTKGGVAFEKLEIHVYEDSSLNDLVAVGKTDANGVYTFEAEYSKDYVAVLKNMPQGYVVENYYSLEETTLTLALEAKLLAVGDVASALKLGGVAADMTVTTADGTTYSISELLKTKEAVVLNFWFEGCDPCRAEFPYMEEAYKEYSDKIEILAINPYDGDDASVAAYKANMGLTFPMAKADAAYATAYGVKAFPTTVVIDRYGTIGFMHTGSVPSTDSFKALFEYFTGEDYVQTTVRNLDDLVTKVEGGDGSKENPFEEYRTDFEIVVDAGKEVYYQMFKVDGMLFEINDPDAYIVFGDKKYEAVDGKVSLILTTEDTYTPAIFAVGNKAAEKKTFAAKLSFVEGSSGNPFVMNLGDFVTKVEADNEQGIYYTYTATENGTFSLQCTGVTTGAKYDYSLYNTTTYALRNLSSDADGDGTVSIEVNAGDVVQISIGVLPNEENKIPATDFNFKASFVKGEGTGVDPDAKVDLTVTVTDKNGNGIAGVVVKFTDDITVSTNASGVATTNLPNGNYVVKITAPKGYKEDTTEYIMTKANNTLSITLEKTETAKKTYKVTVVDESGKAIAGAGVTVNGSYVKADANGVASYTLEEGSYTASVAADGYVSASKSFGNATEITVTLKKETVAVSKVTYTVDVVTYKNKVVKNVTVQFLSGDAVIAEAKADSTGKASVSLEEGTYTARVSDDKYGSGRITLTASAPSSKLIAAESVDTSDTQVMCEKTVTTTKLGGRYAKLNSGDNYFVYTPSQSGKFVVRTDSSEAVKTNGSDEKVSYCGSSQHYLSNPNYEGNEIVINVTEDQVGHTLCVFSVTGSTDTVIVIERIGDAEVAKECVEYKGTFIPSAYKHTLPAGTQKWVDVTGSFTYVKGSDGYYHKDSATGPVIYVTLGGANVKYISMKDLLDNGPLRNYDKLEDYTTLMLQYVSCMDEDYGIFPLTEDLIYMYQNGGAAKGWYDKSTTTGFYLFGDKTVNKDIAWMFECCYWE